MNHSGKRILSLLLIVFLCFHFSSIIIYSAPVKIKSPLFKVASSLYCYPYFHQQWTVFVPAPTKHFDLMIRIGSEHNRQPWINLTQTLITGNRRNVIAGGETEVLMITNSINYLSHDLGEKNTVFNKRPDLPSFNVLERAAIYYFRNFRCPKKQTNYELLLITTANGNTTACYFKNLSLL